MDRNYTGFRVNRQLFSGFLTALNSLAQQFNRQMDSISLGDIAIYYQIENDLIIAMATDRNDNEQEVRRKLQIVCDEFYLKFGNILANWDGNLAYFDPFLKELDRILMLDWNFEYDRQIKSDKMKPSYPTKNVISLTQRGEDLFKVLKEKTIKKE
ncbi:MAG: hypothetical protein ACTSRS_15860 [Candidatus Helarchaeota archaeon]